MVASNMKQRLTIFVDQEILSEIREEAGLFGNGRADDWAARRLLYAYRPGIGEQEMREVASRRSASPLPA